MSQEARFSSSKMVVRISNGTGRSREKKTERYPRGRSVCVCCEPFLGAARASVILERPAEWVGGGGMQLGSGETCIQSI